MTEFYAQPCSLDHTGFYFDSIEKYESGTRTCKRLFQLVEFIPARHINAKINVGCCAADINSIAHAQDHIPGSSPDYEVWNPDLACCSIQRFEHCEKQSIYLLR